MTVETDNRTTDNAAPDNATTSPNVKVFILSGVSGAGKTQWVKDNFSNQTTFTVSANDFFTTAEGRYEFNPLQLPKAHRMCLFNFTKILTRCTDRSAVDGNLRFIFVDNTNTTELEVAPYIRLSQAFGAQVELVLFSCPEAVASARNLHLVPAATIGNQARRIYKLAVICDQALIKRRGQQHLNSLWDDMTISVVDELGRDVPWNKYMASINHGNRYEKP